MIDDAKKRDASKRESAEDSLRRACEDPTTSLQDVHAILGTFPEAVKAANSNGNVPLHLACYSGAPLEIIELLVIYWPESVSQQDHNGSIPLHWACFGNAPLQVVEYLLMRWPQSIQATTNSGEVPLHFATERLDVVKRLTKEYPGAVKATNDNGMLPLHVTCNGVAADLDIIKYLIEQHPASIYCKTSNGLLPIDLARKHGAPKEVIQYLDKEAYSSDTTTQGKVAILTISASAYRLLLT